MWVQWVSISRVLHTIGVSAHVTEGSAPLKTGYACYGWHTSSTPFPVHLTSQELLADNFTIITAPVQSASLYLCMHMLARQNIVFFLSKKIYFSAGFAWRGMTKEQRLGSPEETTRLSFPPASVASKRRWVKHKHHNKNHTYILSVLGFCQLRIFKIRGVRQTL